MIKKGINNYYIMNRGCKNNVDSFYYICSEFVVKKHQRSITEFVKKMYLSYFGTSLGDQDKSWAPHKVCYVCVGIIGENNNN